MKSKATIALVVAALFFAACSGTGDDTAATSTSNGGTTSTGGGDTDTTAGGGSGGGLGQGAGPGTSFAFALQQFDECDALLTWIRAEAAEIVGPYGFNESFGYFRGDRLFAASEDAAGGDDGGVAFEAAPAQVDEGFSTTNVQEAGVDEPDIVKTDGEYLYVLSDNRLHTIDIADTSGVRDTISFDEYYPNEILIGEDRVYVLAQAWGGVIVADGAADAIAPPEYEQPTLVISEVLVDRGRLTLGDQLEIAGSYVTARQIEQGARIVVRHSPQNTLPFVYPSSPAAEEMAAEANRQVVLDSTLEQWLPSYRLHSGNDVTTGLLPECSRVRTAQEFSGTSTLSVLTLDMGAAMTDGTALSLFGAGDTVYASTTSLYAATFAYPNVIFLEDGTVEQDDDFTTAIHQFDISDPAGAEYLASGEVPGHLLNQFAMSEFDGHLRVAVTEGSPWFCCSDEPSVSSVHVLARDGGKLVTVGQVGDLGVDESIFGVRFVGATGYVVTFRQTDPLYVVDLSDPTAPSVTGELKITGYSAYLHPVGDGLVIGVGQEATTDGATVGTKVSLFDVSDPADPREIDRWVEERSSSSVEWDHRAFLYWAPESLAVIPIDSWGSQTSGAVVLEVADRALVERARISQIPPVDPDLPDGCEIIDVGVFEGTELEWLAYEGGLVVSCDEGAQPRSVGGYFCEPLEGFGIDDASIDEVLDPDASIGICWPEYYDRGEIRRSVVTGDVLWTVGHRTVQANDLATLDAIERITL